ncbi:MAG: helix-turn-helix domain-containing protein [Chloroflexota bacterium]
MKFTQVALASRMNISQSDLSKLERRQDIRLSTLKAYVKALGGNFEISYVRKGARRIVIVF